MYSARIHEQTPPQEVFTFKALELFLCYTCRVEPLTDIADFNPLSTMRNIKFAVLLRKTAIYGSDESMNNARNSLQRQIAL